MAKSKIIVITLIKVINIIFDLGILQLIYLLSKKNLKTCFLYAINPVTILITTLHGQFDVIPVFFILLTIYLLNKKQELLSVLSFSFAVFTKTWPILFLIPIVRRIKSKKLIFLIIFFPALFIFIYIWLFKSSLFNISKTLIYYQGLWGIWGAIEFVRKNYNIVAKIINFNISDLFFSYSILKRNKNLIEEFLDLLFFFFVFTTNFSIQYFVWIVPFLYLIKPKKYLWLIVLISLYLFSFYCLWLFNLNLTNIQNILGLILWLSFIKIGYLSKKIA